MTKRELDRLSDQQLVEYLIAGDDYVVRYLFYDKCSKLFGFIIKEVFHYRVNKDELVSELYLYLQENNWNKVRKFNYQSRFTTWLSVVAVRFFKNRRSKMIDLGELESQYNKGGYYTQEELIARIDLYKAIRNLKSSRDKYVIIAIELRGEEESEVAKKLGVTVANLYNIKKRAKERLAKELKEYRYDY